ncbi:MFS transporter [Hyphomonas sp.]|uniref:MFS transporter n=1 Tax=Hyphomonas sp. TaxID=87 RepID=UPI0025C23E09|nr:MFS transporter [Hyphomonas sp.]
MPAKSSKPGRLPLYQLLAYCSLTIPITAVGMPVTTYLPPLYAGQGGLGLATIGLIFMVARIWDVITDPIVGILVDRYQWRHGPRKLWIAFSVPLLCVTAFFLFMPARDEPASALALLFQLLILYTGWTFLQTTHQAWGADLTPDYDERSKLFGYREMMSAGGTLLILSLPALLGSWFAFDAYAEVASMGWFLALILPLTILIAFSLVPDKALAPLPKQRPKMDLSQVLAGMKERAIWRILAVEICVGIGVGVTASTFLFVARGVVGLHSGASSVLLIFFVASIVGIPAWLWVSRRLEKHTALQLVCVYSLACNLVLIPMLLLGHAWLFIPMVALLGLSFGAPQALLRSMIADQVDREEVRSDLNKAGFYFAFMGTSYKVGQAAAIGVSFLLLALIGFNPEVPENPDHRIGLILVFTLVPAIIFALCILLCRNYPLTRDAHEKDRAILRARFAAKTLSQDS